MKQNKLAVITINLGSPMKKMAAMTVPTMQAYADRINADFIVIDKIPDSYQFEEYSAYWAKFILKDYLQEYSRIIYLDLDTIVSENCPNLFEIVPEDSFAAVVEDDYGNDLSGEILAIQGNLGDIGWVKGYINVGVMVMSREHSGLFRLDKNLKCDTKFPEQTLINFNLKKEGYKVHQLSHRFNHMSFLNVPHNDRLHSYISHYAAIPQKLREAMIEEDLRRLAMKVPLLDHPDMDAFISQNFSIEELQQDHFHILFTDAQVFCDMKKTKEYEVC